MRGPCKDCGCDQWEEHYVLGCRVVLTCAEAMADGKELENLKLQISEARGLLQRTMIWIGVDPTSKEQIEIEKVEQDILKFLDATSEKRVEVCAHEWRHDFIRKETFCMKCPAVQVAENRKGVTPE